MFELSTWFVNVEPLEDKHFGESENVSHSFDFFQILDFWQYGLKSTLKTNKNCCRWSDIMAVMLPELTSWEITLENILSMSVLEWLVSLVGCKVYSINELQRMACNFIKKETVVQVGVLWILWDI